MGLCGLQYCNTSVAALFLPLWAAAAAAVAAIAAAAAAAVEVHEALETSVEVLRQLEVFDDITALIDQQPVVSFTSTALIG